VPARRPREWHCHVAEAIDKLESIEFRLSFLAISQSWLTPGGMGNIEDAKTCARAFALISDGADRWIEPEVHRVDALVESDLKPSNEERSRQNSRSDQVCTNSGISIFELRGLLACRAFLVPIEQT
jgi:hypothetical protein